MRYQLEISTPDIVPTPEAILSALGRDEIDSVDPRIQKMAVEAVNILNEMISAQAIYAEVSPDEFSEIYAGAGLNSEITPMDEIYPQATHLALFAVTIGAAISEKISQLFTFGDLALGAILDAGASQAADDAAAFLETIYQGVIHNSDQIQKSTVLRYSPGYCGWHVSGQQKLFGFLHPEEIGIKLNDSSLMMPLKSVSGVMVAGAESIHKFKPDYTFCASCKTRTCQVRSEALSNRAD